MNEQQVLSRLRQLNESEIFYRNYRLSKASGAGFDEYLEQIKCRRAVYPVNEQQVLSRLRQLNESEIFYRNYRLAKASGAGFDEYLEQIDRKKVYQENLLVPEWKDTIPPEYLEDWYFSADRRDGIHVFKHNCYTPAIPHHHNFFEMFFVMEGHCIHHVGENTAVLHAGDLCLIQPKVPHSLDVNDESIIIDVLIRRSTFRQYFYSILQGDNVLSNFFMSTLYSKSGIDYLLFHAQNDPDLHYAFIDLCGETFDQEAYYTVLINAIVTRVFVLLLRRYMSSRIAEGQAGRFRNRINPGPLSAG